MNLRNLTALIEQKYAAAKALRQPPSNSTESTQCPGPPPPAGHSVESVEIDGGPHMADPAAAPWNSPETASTGNTTNSSVASSGQNPAGALSSPSPDGPSTHSTESTECASDPAAPVSSVDSVEFDGASNGAEQPVSDQVAALTHAGQASSISTLSTESDARRGKNRGVGQDDRVAATLADTALLRVVFGERTYPCFVWHPGVGVIGAQIAFDTETTRIQNEYTVPTLVVGAAFNGEAVYLVAPDQMRAFWDTHAQCRVFMCNAPFDLDVVAKACGFDFRDAVEQDRVLDVQALYQLHQLATVGELPHEYNLAFLSQTLLAIELPKPDDVRTGFERFLVAGKVDIASIEASSLEYAARDPIATYALGQKLEADVRSVADQHGVPGLLTHGIQLRGAWAIRHVIRNGVHVDTVRAASELGRVESEKQPHLAALHKTGYVPGRSGNKAVYDQIVGAVATRLGIAIPKTSDGHVSQREEHLDAIKDDPFVAAFLAYGDLHKVGSFFKLLAESGGLIHPDFHMAVTGRAICRKPNLQQLPRAGGIRECIMASPGRVFARVDYKFIELCTLAETCYQRYGESKLMDVINSGRDPHVMVAAMITGKSPEAVTEDERQRAKVANFGLPGGLGRQTFIQHARTTYGVTFSDDEAQNWINKWLATFPEVRRYLEEGDDNITVLARRVGLTDYPQPYGANPLIRAACALMRIAGGNPATTKGRYFTAQEIAWAWRKIAEVLGGNAKFKKAIQEQRGSPELQRALTAGRAATTLTGRVRAKCAANEAKNAPFQGLAADGMKLALYDLVMRRGHRIVLTVHDEVLDEIDDASDVAAMSKETADVMVEQMHSLCPHVKIAVDLVLEYRWSKAKALYDQDGTLVPRDERPLPEGAAAALPADETQVVTPAPTESTELKIDGAVVGAAPEPPAAVPTSPAATQGQVEAWARATLEHLDDLFPGIDWGQGSANVTEKHAYSRARALARDIAAGLHNDVYYLGLANTLRAATGVDEQMRTQLTTLASEAPWITKTNWRTPPENKLSRKE